MAYIITVKKQERVSTEAGVNTTAVQDAEIYRQTLEEFNLSKFVIALNKLPRVRKAKTAKP